MAINLPSPLTASRDPFTTILHLILVIVTIILSLITYILESRLNPRPRHLISGVATQRRPRQRSTNSDPFEPTSDGNEDPEAEEEQVRRTPKRARACLAIFRFSIFAAIAASVAFACLDVVKYMSAPAFAPLASKRSNEWMHAVMLRSVLAAGANMKTEEAQVLASPRLRVGLGEKAVTPDGKPGSRFRWAALMFAIAVVAIVGALMAVVVELLPMKRAVAFVIGVQAVFWLIAGLVAAFVPDTKLPVDASGLRNHWTDRVYDTKAKFVNQTRMVGNWYVAIPQSGGGERIVPVTELPKFEEAFCGQFLGLMPKTGAEVEENGSGDSDEPSNTSPGDGNQPSTDAPATAAPATTAASGDSGPSDPGSGDNRPVNEETQPSVRQDSSSVGHPDLPKADSVPVTQLTRSNAEEVFLVYLVGKPIGLDRYRILSYFALGGMLGAPVLIGQFCRTWFLYPFVAAWAAIWVMFTLLGTPTVLRVLSLPTDKRSVFNVCETDYHVLVMDRVTKFVARIDAAIFGLVLLAAVIYGFRWGYFAEKSAVEKDEKEVKLVNFEDVFSRSGSLRW